MLSANQGKKAPPQPPTQLIFCRPVFPGDFSLSRLCYSQFATGSSVQRSVGRPIGPRQPFPIGRKYLKYARNGYLPNTTITQTHAFSDFARRRKSCRDDRISFLPLFLDLLLRGVRGGKKKKKKGVIDVVIRSVSLPFTHIQTGTNTQKSSTLASIKVIGGGEKKYISFDE